MRLVALVAASAIIAFLLAALALPIPLPFGAEAVLTAAAFTLLLYLLYSLLGRRKPPERR